jgi:hypothetical protein
MPGRTFPTGGFENGPQGTLRMSNAFAKQNNTRCNVWARQILIPKTSWTPQRTFDDLVAWRLDQIQRTKTAKSKQDITLNGHPGREWTFEDTFGSERNTSHVRMYLVGYWFYELQIEGEGTPPTDEHVRAFFDSFQPMIDTPASPPSTPQIASNSPSSSSNSLSTSSNSPNAAAQPSTRIPVGWEVYSPPGISYMIWLPGKATAQSQLIQTPVGRFQVSIARAIGKNGSISGVVYMDLPPFTTENTPEWFLDQMGRSVLNQNGVNSFQQTEISLNGHPGREQTATSDVAGTRLVIRGRNYVVGRRYYHLIWTDSPENVGNGDIETFYNSFRLMGEAGLPPVSSQTLAAVWMRVARLGWSVDSSRRARR